jgi:hypothetical protein
MSRFVCHESDASAAQREATCRGNPDTSHGLLHIRGNVAAVERAARHPDGGWSPPESLTVSGISRHDHERFGGGRYPDRICGKPIPLSTKILAVADAPAGRSQLRARRACIARLAPVQHVVNTTDDPERTQLDAGACRSVGYAACVGPAASLVRGRVGCCSCRASRAGLGT